MKKILVILPNNLGDVIMATPVLEGLKAGYPGCFISFFVENGFEAGIENIPFCDEIIQFPRKDVRDLLKSPHWETADNPLRSIIQRITREGFDSVLNLCQHEYISYVVPLMKGKTIVGRHFLAEGNHAVSDPWSQYLYAIPFSRQSNSLHATDVYRRIAGIKSHGGGYSVHITPSEKTWAGYFLAAHGVDLQKKIMVFQPGAAYPSKCWPIEHFIALGRLLTERGWQILITGAPSETGRAKGIGEGIGRNCFLIAGDTGFRQSMAACGIAHGCVAGDTAQMHAAAGLHVPVYALFGPTNPVETGPYGSGNWVFSGDCPGRPCFKTKCDINRCMRSIMPETVLSCIEHEDPGKNARCDVYRTETRRNGDFTLLPVSANAHSYFNETNSRFTQKAFEPENGKRVFTENEKDLLSQETLPWLELVERLKGILEQYALTHDSALIGEYERQKQTLVNFKGVGEFWTALLNIRLNSVPLLNPLEGIQQSIGVCGSMIGQIRNAMK